MSSGTIETGPSSEALPIHRALASLQEEREAIGFYRAASVAMKLQST